MNQQYSVALIGARGYVGEELITLLDQHPNFVLKLAASRSKNGQPVTGYSSDILVFQDTTPDEVAAGQFDMIFLALPNGLAQLYVDEINALSKNSVIIDLSADYRFDPEWHYSLPELIDLPELTGLSDPKSKSAVKRISNPGCYATAMQLALAPIVPLLEGSAHCFGVSGYSGAGTKPSDKNNPELLHDNLIPYQLSEHIHEKEVSHHLSKSVKFTPHVASFFRGISMTVHMSLQEPSDLDELFKLYSKFYAAYPLIKVNKSIPLVNEIQGKPGAIIGGFKLDESRQYLVACCVLDNLLKGAAVQSIQNANLAFNLNPLQGIHYD